MKRVALRLGLLGLFVMSVCSLAQAGEHYWMADVGVQWKDDKTYDPDMLQVLSLTYGYGLDANWSVEIDYTRSIGGGAFERDVTNVAGFDSSPEDGEFSLWITSLGINYRHLLADMYYLKAKIASTYSEEKRTSSQSGKGNLNAENGIAFGLGGGILLGDMLGSSLTLEAEYTLYNNDYSGFLIGANVTF